MRYLGTTITATLLFLTLAGHASAQSPIGKDGQAVKPTVNYSYRLPGTIIDHYNPANVKRKRTARIAWRAYARYVRHAGYAAVNPDDSNQDPGGGGYVCSWATENWLVWIYIYTDNLDRLYACWWYPGGYYRWTAINQWRWHVYGTPDASVLANL